MAIETIVIITTMTVLEIKIIEEIEATKKMIMNLEEEEGDQDHLLIKREIVKPIDMIKAIKEEEVILGKNKEDKNSLKFILKEVLNSYNRDFDFL